MKAQQPIFQSFARVLALSLVLVLAAGSASAALFTVTLSNGTSFETRYRPVEAEWDTDKVMIMTDTGNWIALAKAEVVGVESQVETSGFGYQLNTTTRFIGWTPNDVGPEEEVDANGEVQPKDGGAEEEWSYSYGDEGSGGGGYDFGQFLDIPTDGAPLGGGVSLDSGIE